MYILNSERMNKEKVISEVILSLDKPFKLSTLFEVLELKGITDRDLIVEVVDQLCDSGVIKYSEVENDGWAYNKRNQYV